MTYNHPDFLKNNPYNDDFEDTKRFLRIVFKPGYSVQARELTQLQTLLQNQISKFGDHIFRDGSLVFGGLINADNNQTIRIRVRAGSVLLLDSGLQNLGSAVTNDVWSLNIDFTIRQIGAAGVASIVALGGFHYTKTNNASVQGFGFNVVNNTTFDTTVSNTLDVTAQWGAASTGNNIYSDIFILNKTF